MVYMYIRTTGEEEQSTTLNTKIHDHRATPLSEVQEHNKKEVYHVADPRVKYDEADDVCNQLGGKLASYDQVLHAYQHGANWCAHGWSKDQLALYPTQRKIWKKIQNAENPEEREMCGFAGINGGKFDKEMKFGVNCYGKKPEQLRTYKHPKLPKQMKEKKESETRRYHDLVVIPYDRKRWSREDYEPAQSQVIREQ
tara:strand:+ start:367 stop:957 length:591 start_codon:yes stop_codon:yes gene_type:complete